jgi:hypothetical protein
VLRAHGARWRRTGGHARATYGASDALARTRSLAAVVARAAKRAAGCWPSSPRPSPSPRPSSWHAHPRGYTHTYTPAAYRKRPTAPRCFLTHHHCTHLRAHRCARLAARTSWRRCASRCSSASWVRPAYVRMLRVIMRAHVVLLLVRVCVFLRATG